ncbi:MAG: RNA polymerase sigma factor [Acidobacteriia bacterium]|nr:RNA polymerase sigma factor [Terriglobia bacterium]
MSAPYILAQPLFYWPRQQSRISMPIPSSATDQEIALWVRGGNRESIGILVNRYSPSLYRYLVHLTGDPPRAEDILQETWLKTMEHIDRYDPGHSFKAWLFAIAKNCAIDTWRRVTREGRVPPGWVPEDNNAPDPMDQLADDEISALDRIEEDELQAHVETIFPTLPPHYREALSLRFQEEMPLEEISQVLCVPLSTVKTRVRRGLELLRRRLIQWEGRSHE